MTASLRKSSRARPTSHCNVTTTAPKKQHIDPCMYPRTGRRGAPQVFPRKLFQILDEVDEDVISWTNSHGTSFTIHDMEYFTEHVLLNYFRHQKYSSFQRQLNLYGFHKISKGPETGAYAHACFLRDKPELLMGVRRLPQRVAAAVSKAAQSKRDYKIVLKKPVDSSKQGAFSRLASCMTRKSERSKESSSSDESSLSSEIEEDSDMESNSNVNIPTFRDVVEDSIDSISQADEILFGLSDSGEEYALENLEQDGIVRVQPLPKECIIDSSAKVLDGISEAVNKLAIERSPVAVAKTTSVLPESSHLWAVKKAPKPLSPNSSGLQGLIPILVRAGSSAFAYGKEVKYDDSDMKTVIEDLQTLDKGETNMSLPRSKSSSTDAIQFGNPSTMSRFTSEAWIVDPASCDEDLDQFFNSGGIDRVFLHQESSEVIPPKPVEMER